MKMEDLGNGRVFYSRGPHRKIALYLHGLTQDFNSLFDQEIITRTVLHTDYSVLAFTFDFFREGTVPSQDLEREVEQLRQAIAWVCQEYNVDTVTLVGKSLGGLVALAYVAIPEFSQGTVEKVCVLGLPFLLGFPPRIGLLKGEVTVAFDFQAEFRTLLQSLQSLPVHIIQGGADDLGPTRELRDFVQPFLKVTLDIVPDADHSFMRHDGAAYTTCADFLLKNLQG